MWISEGEAVTTPPTAGTALTSVACADALPGKLRASPVAMARAKNNLVLLMSALREDRLADRVGKDVVEKKMQLGDDAPVFAAGFVDRDHRLERDLIGIARIDDAGIDRAGGPG